MAAAIALASANAMQPAGAASSCAAAASSREGLVDFAGAQNKIFESGKAEATLSIGSLEECGFFMPSGR